jgi:hypothetical protein
LPGPNFTGSTVTGTPWALIEPMSLRSLRMRPCRPAIRLPVPIFEFDAEKHQRDCTYRYREGNVLVFSERLSRVVFGGKVLIRDHALFGDKREAPKTVYFAIGPRKSVPLFRIVRLDPRDKPAYPTTASDLGDEEIDTRPQRDEKKDLDFEARHLPPSYMVR